VSRPEASGDAGLCRRRQSILSASHVQIGEILTELTDELSYEVCRLDLSRETLNQLVLSSTFRIFG